MAGDKHAPWFLAGEGDREGIFMAYAIGGPGCPGCELGDHLRQRSSSNQPSNTCGKLFAKLFGGCFPTREPAEARVHEHDYDAGGGRLTRGGAVGAGCKGGCFRAGSEGGKGGDAGHYGVGGTGGAGGRGGFLAAGGRGGRGGDGFVGGDGGRGGEGWRSADGRLCAPGGAAGSGRDGARGRGGVGGFGGLGWQGGTGGKGGPARKI